MADTLKKQIEEMEREAIRAALEKCYWIQARAARILGITERMIGYKIKKYGIDKGGDEGQQKTESNTQ